MGNKIDKFKLSVIIMLGGSVANLGSVATNAAETSTNQVITQSSTSETCTKLNTCSQVLVPQTQQVSFVSTVTPMHTFAQAAVPQFAHTLSAVQSISHAAGTISNDNEIKRKFDVFKGRYIQGIAANRFPDILKKYHLATPTNDGGMKDKFLVNINRVIESKNVVAMLNFGKLNALVEIDEHNRKLNLIEHCSYHFFANSNQDTEWIKEGKEKKTIQDKIAKEWLEAQVADEFVTEFNRLIRDPQLSDRDIESKLDAIKAKLNASNSNILGK